MPLGAPEVGPNLPISGARANSVGSRAKEKISSPTIATTWLRTSPPTHTPIAAAKADTARFRHSTSARSPNPTVVSPRPSRIRLPTAMIVSVTTRDSTTPAVA